MPKMVQIRNVPDSVHRRLKVRAAAAGMSLSEYLNRQVAHLVETPTLEELLNRLSRQRPVALSETIEEAVQAEREGR